MADVDSAIHSLGIGGHDIFSVLKSVSESYPDVIKLIGAVSVLIGILFVYKALHSLYEHGIQHGRGSHNSSIGSILSQLLIGAALFYLPSAINSVSETIFGSGGYALLDYESIDEISNKMNEAMKYIYQFIGIVGYIAVVRGLMVLRATTNGERDASVAKGLTHIIGGALAANLQATINMLKATAGF